MNFAMELVLALGLMGDVNLNGLKPEEVTCLAQNIYHEARGEDLIGQRAVAYVTLNRAVDGRWPHTICGVVHQKNQFSWVKKRPEIAEPAAYERAEMVAMAAMFGLSKDPTNGATYFYDHKAVTPRWSHKLKTVAVIGDHTFKR